MPQRILALDISDAELKAAVVETTFRDYKVAGFYREPLSVANGTLEAQVHRFVEQHAPESDTVLSAIPADFVTWRTFFLPFRDRKRLAQTIPFELENLVPFGLEEVVVDYQILHRDRAGVLVLAALVQKRDLEKHLEMLRAAGIDPKVVDLSPLAALNILSLVPELPPTFVFIDFGAQATTVALYRNRELTGLRVLSATAKLAEGGNGTDHTNGSGGTDLVSMLQEVRWTLLALNGAPLEEDLPCYIAGELPDLDRLAQQLGEGLGVEVRRMDRIPLKNLESEAGSQAAAFTSSLGLALREVASANALGLNFRQGEFSYHRGQEELRRGMRTTIALGLIAGAMLVTHLVVQYRQLESRIGQIDSQIVKVFHDALPDAKSVKSPQIALKAEIDDLENRLALLNSVVPVSSSTSVDILRAISEAIPNKIRIDADDYAMDPDAVRIKGNADTFEAVDTIKQQLLATGFFTDVQVKDTKAAKDGHSVDFRLQLVLSKDLRRQQTKHP